MERKNSQKRNGNFPDPWFRSPCNGKEQKLLNITEDCAMIAGVIALSIVDLIASREARTAKWLAEIAEIAEIRGLHPLGETAKRRTDG